MKKVLIGSSFALLALVVLSSCKKDYTCTCTETNTGTSGSLVTSTVITGTKKDATAACTALSSSLGTYSKVCVIQ